MIIAWWSKTSPDVINLQPRDTLFWFGADWIEWQPASPEQVEMYKKGVTIYSIRGLK